MYDMQDEPVVESLETIHLYVVREGQERPSLIPVLISVVSLSFLFATGVLTPYQQPEQRALIRVPAVLLPPTTFSISVSILPTGVKTYPATSAHGTLTITNGSVIAQILPQGFTVDGVATDRAVFVPAGSANGYGSTIVPAHALVSGIQGNLPALAVNVVEGSSIYIRNLQPFTGGADSYAMRFITAQDRENALSQARATLFHQTLSGLLSHPCLEHVTGTTSLHVAWTCQFVTYTAPALPQLHVLRAQVSGRIVFLIITYVPRPQHLETK